MGAWYSMRGLASDLLTSKEPGVRRLAVDSQQTSLEENKQFKYHELFQDVSQSEQIVYLFTANTDLFVFGRRLNFWSGGRLYAVYPQGAGESFTGTLTDVTDRIGAINGVLHGDLTEHPESQVTIQRAQGANIFDVGTSYARTSDAVVVADGNKNTRASSSLSQSGDRNGVAEGVSFYLVFEPVGASEDLNGAFELKWEER